MARTLDEYLKLDLKNNHFRYMPADVKAELIARTPNCVTTSLDERAYWLQYGLVAYPTCKRCASALSSKNWYPSINQTQRAQGWPPKGYRPYCSKTCAMNADTKHQRTVQTCIDRYGVPHVSQSEEHQAKRKLTNLERYGAENPMAWGSERFRETIRQLYGVVSVRHIEGVSEKKVTKASQSLELLKARVPELERMFEVNLLSELPTTLERIYDIELRWKHTCGHVYTSNISERGLRFCPRCSNGSLQAERALGDWLETQGIEVCRRDQRFGFEVDLYLPKHHLAIEYDGTYWHSARFVSREKSMQKLESAEKAGVQLVTIQEHLWLFHEEKVKARLNSLLGKTVPVMARRCQIEELEFREARDFLNEAHLQGAAKAPIALGLRQSGELVAVMTFGRPRFARGVDWELIRYASKPGISIQGGASKLLSAFRKRYAGSIISYADRCWSTGKLYRAIGFEFQRNSAPSYFWVSGQHIFSRYQTQKKKLPQLLASIGKPFDPAFSESDNMFAAKFLKVYDRGNSVWLLR